MARQLAEILQLSRASGTWNLRYDLRERFGRAVPPATSGSWTMRDSSGVDVATGPLKINSREPNAIGKRVNAVVACINASAVEPGEYSFVARVFFLNGDDDYILQSVRIR